MQYNIDFGISAYYKKHLSFCYGNKKRLIIEFEKAIKMYDDCNRSEKVKERILKYKKIIEIAKEQIILEDKDI